MVVWVLSGWPVAGVLTVAGILGSRLRLSTNGFDHSLKGRNGDESLLGHPPADVEPSTGPPGNPRVRLGHRCRAATVTTSLGRRCPPIDRGPVDRRRDAAS